MPVDWALSRPRRVNWIPFALKAIDCGVDGLVVEGGEGGGFKNPSPVSTMVLLPLIRSRVDVPIIAAGGIADGLSMAGAFAMGAEGVQMGTRMLSCLESPVHNNWKQAVVAAKETDTVFLNQASRPALRALRTQRTEDLLPLCVVLRMPVPVDRARRGRVKTSA
jgi:enoyl-[acyl-carrier protein] reductase II